MSQEGGVVTVDIKHCIGVEKLSPDEKAVHVHVGGEGGLLLQRTCAPVRSCHSPWRHRSGVAARQTPGPALEGLE